MDFKFTSRKTSNQNIKITGLVANSIPSNTTKLNKYTYNDVIFFYYFLKIESSRVIVEIAPNFKKKEFEFKTYIGSFLYDLAEKFSANSIEISSIDKNLNDIIVFEFLQKDFIYNKYLKNSSVSKYITNYKLKNKLHYLHHSLNLLKRLVSEPSNVLYPETFSKIAKKEINHNNTHTNILNKKQIEKIGLRCLLSVNQGSAREPRVVTFNKRGFNKNVDILFVGKGVCFDTGGISIKPSSGMEEMKWDMAGAGVVCAIIKYLSNIKTNFSYAGIVGLVENMPDGKAYKPGDIIKSYKGINVEVLNTDAEGRLVLADIISYGCDIFKPKLVIDFATLTGAIMIALGQHYSGLYSNDDILAEKLFQSGLSTNEKVWRMPLHEDFDKELNSPFVDLKNITNSRYGGSVTAAQFLKRFVPKDTKWAHLDIAGVTWKNSGDMMNNKGATGFGLTLISDFIDKYF